MSKKEQEQPKPENAARFEIHRLYVKDLSFESPRAPALFKEQWQPDVQLDIQRTDTELEANVQEVVLAVTATVKSGDDVAFVAEVKYAGIFGIEGVEEGDLEQILGSFCPTILFPYVREAISDLTIRGGFPPLYLSPINFDALYAQHKAKQAEGNKKLA